MNFDRPLIADTSAWPALSSEGVGAMVKMCAPGERARVRGGVGGRRVLCVGVGGRAPVHGCMHMCVCAERVEANHESAVRGWSKS